GDRAVVVECDIRSAQDRDRLIDTAAEHGQLFALVNNAGIARMRPLLDETVQDWRDTLETNLEAAFFLAQRAVEHMRPHGEGRIVNIASMHGIVGLNNQGLGNRAPETTPGDRGPVRESAYAASKGALIQMTRDLAAAVGRWGITVNAISPGNVPRPDDHQNPPTTTNPDTPRPPQLGDKMPPEVAQALAMQTPLQRLGTVDEIAGPVSFLLSRDATYITGANLVVDGGFTSW
ncbi:SDR family oxidoreductase, partial [Phytoactinopolyspora alkaliphila]